MRARIGIGVKWLYNESMAKEALLKTEDLCKVYGKKDSRLDALKDVNLEINAGETVAIVGKSGSGKSTLMHLLALFYELK